VSGRFDGVLYLNGVCAGGAALIPAVAAQPQNQRWRIWDVHCHMGRLPGETPEQRIEGQIVAGDPTG
jgi:hypothetical protein